MKWDEIKAQYIEEKINHVLHDMVITKTIEEKTLRPIIEVKTYYSAEAAQDLRQWFGNADIDAIIGARFASEFKKKLSDMYTRGDL